MARCLSYPVKRSYDSLARELGISRERVRQLESDALIRLAWALRHDRYALLWWRAASAAQNETASAPVDAQPYWLAKLLHWLAAAAG